MTNTNPNIDIFDKLVKNENDIVGLAAFGLYTLDKKKQIEKFEEKESKQITLGKLSIIDNVLDTKTETYLKDAHSLMDAVYEKLVESNLDAICSEYYLKKITEQYQDIKIDISNLATKQNIDNLPQKTDISLLTHKKPYYQNLGINFSYRFFWLVLLGLIGFVIVNNNSRIIKLGKEFNKIVTKEKTGVSKNK